MRRFILVTCTVLCFPLLIQPASAEEQEDGLSLMEEGALLFLEGLQQQMEPALEGLGDLADEFGPALESFSAEMGPALGALLSEVEDWSAYHPPEVLDNGDIIIRRKDHEQQTEPTDEPETDQTDL